MVSGVLISWAAMYAYYENKEVLANKVNAYYMSISSKYSKLVSREWMYTTNHKKLGMIYI